MISSSRWQGPLELQAVCRVPCRALPDTFLVYLEMCWEKETLVLLQKLIVQQASEVSLELFERTPSWIGQTSAQVPLGSSFHHATLHLWGSCVTIQRGVASPSSHEENRGERFFRVGGGGGAVHRLFFTMTALKIRYAYLNDSHYSSIGFRMGLILLSKKKIVILIVELRD